MNFFFVCFPLRRPLQHATLAHYAPPYMVTSYKIRLILIKYI